MMLAIAHAVLVELKEERKLEGREGREEREGRTLPLVRAVYYKRYDADSVEATDQTPLVLEGEGKDVGEEEEEEKRR